MVLPSTFLIGRTQLDSTALPDPAQIFLFAWALVADLGGSLGVSCIHEKVKDGKELHRVAQEN